MSLIKKQMTVCSLELLDFQNFSRKSTAVISACSYKSELVIELVGAEQNIQKVIDYLRGAGKLLAVDGEFIDRDYLYEEDRT